MKNDSNKKFLLYTLLFNNRLDWYDFYLRYAITQGYTLTSFIDYLENPAYANKKVMILRHDIDRSVKNARLMFSIEKKHNVRATYYFRWSTFDKEFIEQLVESGFEVGLHYETLGTYCTQNNIRIVDNEVIRVCKERLKNEIQIFNRDAGVHIKTVCAHGSSINRQLCVTNNVLLENEDYQNFDIKCAAYDKDFYNKVDAHIMDTNLLNNFGFSYKHNPIQSIKDGNKLIVFLSHPAHWNLKMSQRIKMLIKLILGQYTTNTTRVFQRINLAGLASNKSKLRD